MTTNRLFLIITGLLMALNAEALNFGNETLKYKVEYKWGLVEKTAGHVTIKLTSQPTKSHSKLTASTDKWADKFYKVRDTLECEFEKSPFRPIFYEKNSHEGGDDKHDYVKYSFSGNKVIGDCVRKSWKKGELKRNETRRLEATGTTVDMLSAFYYMRALPYGTYTGGHKTVINIFSGKQKELLTITYLGKERIEYDKKAYECYHISFKFTSDGKKKTSDDMDAWIDVNGTHIPIKLEGKLPIGKVRCFYEP